MTFKSTGITFIISVCIILSLFYFWGISLWWIMLPLLVFVLFVIYGSANIQSNFYTKAFCSANITEKKIAITFDDGPDKECTQKALSILEEYNAKATFFLIGKKIEGNESIVKQIDAAGHTIGNHTFSHSFFIDFKNANGFAEELNQTSDLVFKLTGKRMKLFRPPYGVTTPNLAKAAKALKYHIIGWNVRSLDTTNDREEKIVSRVTQQLKPGAVVLFHDTSEKTIGVLKQTLEFAKQNGFKIVSMQSLLNTQPYE